MTQATRVLALLVVLLASACGGPRPPWDKAPLTLDLRATLSTSTVPLLGDVELTLDLFARQDLEVEFAAKVPDKGFAGTVTDLPPQPFEHGTWRRTVLKLRPIEGPGTLTIAPFSAKAKDGTVAATTPELKLEVTSLLAEAGPGLEDHSELLVPRWPWWWWAVGGAAVLLLVLFLWWWRRRPQPGAASPTEVPLPPHVKAQRALARLRHEPRTTPAQIEQFYVQVSLVLRVYLEERFGLHAPERTTEEFLQEIEGSDRMAVDQNLRLKRFLGQCDLVKFAAMVPGEDVHLETFALAEQFVEATRVDRAQAVPA
ncbi:MAG: hypothetical protein IPK26_08470 [Planctomycetes bacterium]|nr:hypothetical protein [Planctomycetota bacterium]